MSNALQSNRGGKMKYSIFITRVIRIPITAKNKMEVCEKVEGFSEEYINGFDFDEHIDIEEEK